MTQQIINNGDSGLVARTGINDNFTELYGITLQVEWFEEIASGTGGTIIPPTGSTISLNEYPEGGDALVSEMDAAENIPTFTTAFTAGGVPVTSTLTAGGVYVLSGTPASYPIGIIYVYTVPAVSFDDTKSLAVIRVDDVTTAVAIDWENPIAINTATTLTIGKHHVISDLGTPADYTVNLPAVSGNAGKLISWEIAAAATKIVTVDGNASETIDGELTRVMWAEETAILLCDGVTWTKVAGKSIPMRYAAFATASQTGLSTGAAYTVALPTEAYDIGGVFDTSTYEFTPRRSMDVAFTFGLRMSPTTTDRLKFSQTYVRYAAVPVSLGQEFQYPDNINNSVTMSGGTQFPVVAGTGYYLIAYGETFSGTWFVNGTGTTSPLYYGGVFFTGAEILSW